MARKKEPEKAANHERWLVSYADFITLLFAVFVTLYAMSQVDKKKVEEVAASYKQAFGLTKGAPTGNSPNILPNTDLAPLPPLPIEPARPQATKPQPPSKTKREDGKPTDALDKVRAGDKEFKTIKLSIEHFLVQQQAEDKVRVAIMPRGLVISLEEAGFFDSGSAAVKMSSYPLLAKVGESLAPYSNPLRIEGHTDNIPMSSALYKSNWELSTSRATNILHVLAEHHGFPPENMSVAGYGEYRPIADNAIKEGRQKNRRVEIVLLKANNHGEAP